MEACLLGCKFHAKNIPRKCRLSPLSLVKAHVQVPADRLQLDASYLRTGGGAILARTHIRLRESLPDVLTLRVQGGSFNTLRTFLAYSPLLSDADSFIAYEASRTDGPFLSPLRYKRDNLTGNYTRRLSESRAIGFKLNIGRNDFFSSMLTAHRTGSPTLR